MKRKIYKRAMEYLVLLKKKREDFNGLQHYGLCYSDRPDMWNSNTACYTQINGSELGIVEGCEALYTVTRESHGHGYLNPEDAEPYYKWLLQDSPMAKVFKTKSVKTCLNLGVVCHTDVRCDLFGAAIIAHRTPWEFPRSIKLWKIMVEGGIVPEVAFLLMSCFNSDFDIVRVTDMSGHFPVSPYQSHDAVVNILKGEPIEDHPTFREYKGYSGCTAMWSKEVKPNDPTQLLNYFEEIFKKKFKGQRGQFGGSTIGKATVEQFLSIVLEYQGTLLKEFV